MNVFRSFLALLSVAVSLAAHAAGPGDIDPTFGKSGIFQPAAECCGSAGGTALAIQPDGKLLVGGYGQNGSTQTQDAVVARLNPDGTLDTNFGAAGIARVTLAGQRSEVRFILALPDGGIVAAGFRAPASGTPRQGFVARLDATGKLVSSFGANGVLQLGPLVSGSTAFTIRRALLQADGKIVLAGGVTLAGNDTDMFVARLTAAGALDSAFGFGGVTLSGLVERDEAHDAAIASNGNILVAGTAIVSGTNYGALMRLLPSGQLDPSFDNDGIKAPLLGFPTQLRSIAVQDDGRILVGGSLDSSAAVMRFMADGTLDTSYGNSGATSFTASTIMRIVMSGAYAIVLGDGFSSGSIQVRRLNPDGTLDSTFTFTRGFFPATTSDFRTAEIGLTGTSIYMTGPLTSTSIDTQKFAAPTGTWDNTTFGTTGVAKVLPGLSTQTGDLNFLALTADGSILFPRPAQNLASTIVTKLTPDGREDTGFGTAGRATVGNSSVFSGPIAVKPNEKFLLASTNGNTVLQFLPQGTTDPGYSPPTLPNFGTPYLATYPDNRFMFGNGTRIARYSDTGTIDPTFNFGQVLVPTSNTTWTSIALHPSSGFFLGGTRFTDRSVGSVERHLDNGELDLSYGTNGRVDFAISSSSTSVVKIIAQPDGKLLVGGTGTVPSAGTLAPNTIYVMRILPNGFFDASFANGTGIARMPSFGTLPVARSMALQADGKILIGGIEGSASTTFRGFVWRLNADGTADSTFGQFGLAYVDTSPGSDGVTQVALQPTGGIVLGGSASGSYAVWRMFASAAGPGSPASSLVSNYYRTILGRNADSAGQAFWEGEVARIISLGAGASEPFFIMAGSFFTGAEYLQKNTSNPQYVTDLYATFFARAPDTAGSDYWVSQLASGRPRDAVMNEFLFSTEYGNFMTALFGSANVSPAEVAMVMDFFRGILHRLPDTAGFNYWVGRLRAAQCSGTVGNEADQISALFLSSQEYANAEAALPNAEARNAAFMLDLYSAFMRRGADIAGYQFYTQQLNSSAQTREQVRKQFVSSPEFNNRVAAVQGAGCRS